MTIRKSSSKLYNAPMIFAKIKSLIAQFIRFGIVGFLSFLIDYSLFLVLTDVFDIYYLFSSTLSFVVSTIFNFVMSMRYVFRGKQTQTTAQQFTIFFILSLIGLSLNQLLLWICVDYIFLPAWLGKLVATAFVALFNFVTRKFFLEDTNRA